MKLVGLVMRIVPCFLSRALGILDLAVGMYYAHGSLPIPLPSLSYTSFCVCSLS